MKIFDLNVPLETSPSEPLPVGVEHQSHQASAQFMASFFGATVADLPHGYGWANDSVTMNAHSGTHVDAPWHYYPTCADQPARTIDQMPLEWFYGDGVVLDFRAQGARRPDLRGRRPGRARQDRLRPQAPRHRADPDRGRQVLGPA